MLLFWLSFLLAGLPAAPLPEPLANAQQAIKEMRGSVEAVEQARALAEAQGQTDLATCYAQKLVPMQTLLTIAEQTDARLVQAVAENDATHTGLESRKIEVALAKVREFYSEASACLLPSGSSRSTTRLSGSVPDVDVSESGSMDEAEDSLFVPDVIAEPPCSSCF